MPDRLSPLDASFLFAEDRTRAMHVCGVMTFAPADGPEFDMDAFAALIGRRLALVPRYRQKVREVPGHLGLPVWVDDPDFDLDYHVRRSALPRPGTEEQLRALVGRLIARRLDRARPLWEIYLVEGLAEGRVGIVTKTHHAMVDGLASMDVGALLLDSTPEPRETAADEWRPAPEPSALGLAADAASSSPDGSLAGFHSSPGVSRGSGARSSSTAPMSIDASPSTIAWWVLVTTANRPSASPSTM